MAIVVAFASLKIRSGTLNEDMTMSLIFRMLYVYIFSFFREKLPLGPCTSTLNLITLPNDLDINLHMNNGRFLTICDLNRVDMFIRTGLIKVMFKEKWMPIIAEHTMTYKKPLSVFSKFTVSMHLESSDEKYFYMTHEFKRGDKLIAHGTSKAVIKGREGIVPPDIVIEKVTNYREKFK